MRFLVDESTGPYVAGWLRVEGHEVFSAYEQARGTPDDELIRKAAAEDWILITNDKGFGEKVYRDRRPTRASFSCASKMNGRQAKSRRFAASSIGIGTGWQAALSS